MVGMAGVGLGGKIGIGALVLVAAGTIVLFTTAFGKGIRDIWGTGAVQEAIVKKHEDHAYAAATSDENLKALATGLRLYESSEGAYPDAAKWMDQLTPRLILNDLPEKEAVKKLRRPDLAGSADAYGYAMNDAASGKYHGDLSKGTVLIFESAATAKNAHGDPRKEGRRGGRALTIDGAIVSLGH